MKNQKIKLYFPTNSQKISEQNTKLADPIVTKPSTSQPNKTK